MQNNTIRKAWRYKAGVTLVLVAPALLGIGAASSASASTLAPASSAASYLGSKSQVLPPTPTEAPTPTQSASPQAPGETRGRFDAIIRIIKSIPGAWSKFVAGVKKAYSWFVKYVWKPLVAAVNWLGTIVGAWDIWNHFH